MEVKKERKIYEEIHKLKSGGDEEQRWEDEGNEKEEHKSDSKSKKRRCETRKLGETE